jgi:cobalt/nickel transport system permease protein
MTLPLALRDLPDSPLARWDARWKLAALLVAAFAFALLDGLVPSLAALTVGLALVVIARLRARWVRNRLALFALAALPFLIVLPFTLQTDASSAVLRSAWQSSLDASRSAVSRSY